GSIGRSIVTEALDLSPALDEYGVPIVRRSIVFAHPAAAKVVTSNDSIAAESAPKTPVGGAAAPKPTRKVAAIHPITDNVKTQKPTKVVAKGGVAVPAKKRTDSAKAVKESPAKAHK